MWYLEPDSDTPLWSQTLTFSYFATAAGKNQCGGMHMFMHILTLVGLILMEFQVFSGSILYCYSVSIYMTIQSNPIQTILSTPPPTILYYICSGHRINLKPEPIFGTNLIWYIWIIQSNLIWTKIICMLRDLNLRAFALCCHAADHWAILPLCKLPVLTII